MCLITNCQNPGSAKIKINKKYVPKNHQNPPKITAKLQKSRIFFGNACHFRKFFLIRARLRFFCEFSKILGKGNGQLYTAVREFNANPTAATATYGPIAEWRPSPT